MDPAIRDDEVETLRGVVEGLRLEVAALESRRSTCTRRVGAAQAIVDEGELALQRLGGAGAMSAAEAAAAGTARAPLSAGELCRSRDIYAINERLLDLQLLKKPLQRRAAEASAESEKWRRRAEGVRSALETARGELAALPETAHQSSVEVLQRLAGLRDEKRVVDRELRRVGEGGGSGGGGGRGGQGGRGRGGGGLVEEEERLEELDDMLSETRRDERRWRDKFESSGSQLGPLQAQKREWQAKLRRFEGGLTSLLRIVFDTYDETGRGEGGLGA